MVNLIRLSCISITYKALALDITTFPTKDKYEKTDNRVHLMKKKMLSDIFKMYKFNAKKEITHSKSVSLIDFN